MSGTLTLAAGQVFTGGTFVGTGDTGQVAFVDAGIVTFDTTTNPVSRKTFEITQDTLASSQPFLLGTLDTFTITSVTHNRTFPFTKDDMPGPFYPPPGYDIYQTDIGTVIGLQIVSSQGTSNATTSIIGTDGSLALTGVIEIMLPLETIEANVTAVLSLNSQTTGNGLSEIFAPASVEQVAAASSPLLTTTAGGTVTLGSSAKLMDTATLSSGFDPTGTITFSLFDPNDLLVDTETVPVTGNGTYTTPVGYLPTVSGTYRWVGDYSGDLNNAGTTEGGQAEAEVVVGCAPTLVTTAGGTVTLGSSAKLMDTATLSSGFDPTGTITFSLFDPNDLLVDTETVPVTGNGTYTTPVGYLPTVSGTYRWVGDYSGDLNNAGTTEGGQAEAEVVVGAPCFVTGTRIRAERGNIPVEDLRAGDRIHVLKGGVAKPIVWLGHRRIDCSRHPVPAQVWPIRISAGAIGPGCPFRDLYLSPDHALYIGGTLVPVRYLLNGSTIVQRRRREVTYWHVELARHEVLLAEGLACESYLETGNRAAFEDGSTAAAECTASMLMMQRDA